MYVANEIHTKFAVAQGTIILLLHSLCIAIIAVFYHQNFIHSKHYNKLIHLFSDLKHNKLYTIFMNELSRVITNIDIYLEYK